jgi:hypothetical protein
VAKEPDFDIDGTVSQAQAMPSNLTLPLWIIFPRRVEAPPPSDPCDEPSHVVAFSESGKAMDYMDSRQSGAWKVDHVLTEAQLLLIVRNLHHHQIGAICLNPKPDGSGGTKVGLADTFKAIGLIKVSLD